MSEKSRVCEICEKEFTNPNLAVRTCSKECSYKLRIKERYRVDRQYIEKVCVCCNETFLDKSKKKQVVKCTPCIRKEGVAKRRSNGSYVRTEEQNRKMVEKIKELRLQGKALMSDETKARISKGFSDRWKSDEFREKVRLGYLEKYGAEHFMKSNEGRTQASVRSKGQKLSEEARLKMRKGAARRLREGRNQTQFYGRGGVREDIGFYVRSRWEANFARYLIHTNQQFQYEPESFTLSDGRTYTPDFKVGDVYFEVKGWWTPLAKEKFEKFSEEYAHIVVKIIDGSEYNQIENMYSQHITNWEKKNGK